MTIVVLDTGPLSAVTNPRRTVETAADARKGGQPTAANASLDGDVILAAQTIVAFQATAIIATSYVAHLTRFARAEIWSNIA